MGILYRSSVEKLSSWAGCVYNVCMHDCCKHTQHRMTFLWPIFGHLGLLYQLLEAVVMCKLYVTYIVLYGEH